MLHGAALRKALLALAAGRAEPKTLQRLPAPLLALLVRLRALGLLQFSAQARVDNVAWVPLQAPSSPSFKKATYCCALKRIGCCLQVLVDFRGPLTARLAQAIRPAFALLSTERNLNLRSQGLHFAQISGAARGKGSLQGSLGELLLTAMAACMISEAIQGARGTREPKAQGYDRAC